MSCCSKYQAENIVEGISTYITIYYMHANKDWLRYRIDELFPSARIFAPVWSRMNLFQVDKL